MHIGLDLWAQNTTWPALRDAAVFADRLGYDSLWTWDHFYAIAGPADRPNHEGWQILPAWAAITERAKIGMLVTGITHRHPAILAKMAITLDHISNGRAILGIGAAWNELEHGAYGMALGTRKERSDRFAEATRLIRALLTRGRVSFEGRYYQLKDARADPPPVQKKLPILIGGGGEQRTLRTTARYADMWHGYGSPEQIAQKMEILRGHCADVGRDPSEIRVFGGGQLIVRDDQRGIDARLREMEEAHGGWRPAAPTAGTAEAVAQRLAAYARAGVHGFIVGMGHPFDRETIERVAGEVRPRLAQLLD